MLLLLGCDSGVNMPQSQPTAHLFLQKNDFTIDKLCFVYYNPEFDSLQIKKSPTNGCTIAFVGLLLCHDFVVCVFFFVALIIFFISECVIS